jgi:hypothetical protein
MKNKDVDMAAAGAGVGEASLRRFLGRHSVGTVGQDRRAAHAFFEGAAPTVLAREGVARLLRCHHKMPSGLCGLVNDRALADRTGTCTVDVVNDRAPNRGKWASCDKHHFRHHLHKGGADRKKHIMADVRRKLQTAPPRNAARLVQEIALALGPNARPTALQRGAADALLAADLQCRRVDGRCTIKKKTLVAPTLADMRCHPKFDYKRLGAPWLRCVGGAPAPVPVGGGAVGGAPAPVPVGGGAVGGAPAPVPVGGGAVGGGAWAAGPGGAGWVPPAAPNFLSAAMLNQFRMGPTRNCVHDYVQSCGKNVAEMRARCVVNPATGFVDDNYAGGEIDPNECMGFTDYNRPGALLDCVSADYAQGFWAKDEQGQWDFSTNNPNFFDVRNFSHPERVPGVPWTNVAKTPQCQGAKTPTPDNRLLVISITFRDLMHTAYNQLRRFENAIGNAYRRLAWGGGWVLYTPAGRWTEAARFATALDAARNYFNGLTRAQRFAAGLPDTFSSTEPGNWGYFFEATHAAKWDFVSYVARQLPPRAVPANVDALWAAPPAPPPEGATAIGA